MDMLMHHVTDGITFNIAQWKKGIHVASPTRIWIMPLLSLFHWFIDFRLQKLNLPEF